MSEGFRSGFVGIVGPTNSGKSTLMNLLLGKKLSIVSPRAQTTYHGIKGVTTTDTEQTIYIDTPGFQKNSESIARLLNKVADKNVKECDILLWVFDVTTSKFPQQFEQLKQRISNKPPDKSFCLLNKVDKVKKETLLPILQTVYDTKLFSEVIPISAQTGSGVDIVVKLLKERLPEGQHWYAPGQTTDRSQDFVIAEFIREKIYRATRQEIPYSVWVEIEKWPDMSAMPPMENAETAPEEKPVGLSAEPPPAKPKVPTFNAILHVDSDSRRGILIGKGGDMMKRIGVAARKEIEAYLGYQVCLKLNVQVQPHWRDNDRQIKKYLELE